MSGKRTPRQDDLLQKIRDHLQHLNNKYGFADRLARENSWVRSYADEVVNEYSKFLFIAREGGHPVSPPPIIDKAWHLHLLHTEDYWQEFCPKILQIQLHHSPATGTHGEDALFADWSGKTCDSYNKFFGPLPAIWGAPLPFEKSPRTQTSAIVIGGLAVFTGFVGLWTGNLGWEVFGMALALIAFFILIVGRAMAGVRATGKPSTCGGSSCASNSGPESGSGHGGDHGCSGGSHGCGGGH